MWLKDLSGRGRNQKSFELDVAAGGGQPENQQTCRYEFEWLHSVTVATFVPICYPLYVCFMQLIARRYRLSGSLLGFFLSRLTLKISTSSAVLDKHDLLQEINCSSVLLILAHVFAFVPLTVSSSPGLDTSRLASS